MTKSNITKQIAKKLHELGDLFDLMAAPVESQSQTIQKAERADERSAIPQCGCGLEAEVFSGTSKKNGKPFTKYSCGKGFKAKDKCDFVDWGN